MLNTGSHILKEKYDKVVEAINSGVVNETKATCEVLTANYNIHYLNFSYDGAVAH